MNKNDIVRLVENDEYLRSKLFCRGFLFTSDSDIDPDGYPFYGAWKISKVGKHHLYSHPLLSVYIEEDGGLVAALIGHAYNPFTSEIDERRILSELIHYYSDKEKFFEYFNQLTGVFCFFVSDGEDTVVISDVVSLQSVFYSKNLAHNYISSHSNLIGDIVGLEEDPIVTRLKSCSTFRYFGNRLPGNSVQFKELERLNPNFYLTLHPQEKQHRFYYPHQEDLTNEEIVTRLIDVLKNTMRLIPQKWSRPAISLTGGCDSKTVLAAACDVYDEYRYFSYDSQPNEKPDAAAAKQICNELGLPHIFYEIPYEDEAFENIEGISSILMWNGGNVRHTNLNDVRKRAYLDKISDFDVEVKSWSSEVGRRKTTRRYNNKKSFGKPTPRKCTTFYKFLISRRLVHESDKLFKRYLDEYFQQAEKNPIPWQDQFYWEWHWPENGITLICEHGFSDEITVPYNNRMILELLLSASLEDQENDTVYTEIRNRLDKRIDKAADTVVDVNHSAGRAQLELLYYRFNNFLPY